MRQAIQWLKNLFAGTNDERISEEMGHIYKNACIGFMFSGFAAMFYDMMVETVVNAYGLADDGIAQYALPSAMVLALGFLATALTMGVSMVKRGIYDDSRYAEADSFPLKHTLAQGAVISLGGFAALFLLRVFAEVQLVGLAQIRWADAMLLPAVLGACVLICGMACSYLAFRSAKKHRKKNLEDLGA